MHDLIHFLSDLDRIWEALDRLAPEDLGLTPEQAFRLNEEVMETHAQVVRHLQEQDDLVTMVVG